MGAIVAACLAMGWSLKEFARAHPPVLRRDEPAHRLFAAAGRAGARGEGRDPARPSFRQDAHRGSVAPVFLRLLQSDDGPRRGPSRRPASQGAAGKRIAAGDPAAGGHRPRPPGRWRRRQQSPRRHHARDESRPGGGRRCRPRPRFDAGLAQAGDGAAADPAPAAAAARVDPDARRHRLGRAAISHPDPDGRCRHRPGAGGHRSARLEKHSRSPWRRAIWRRGRRSPSTRICCSRRPCRAPPEPREPG